MMFPTTFVERKPSTGSAKRNYYELLLHSPEDAVCDSQRLVHCPSKGRYDDNKEDCSQYDPCPKKSRSEAPLVDSRNRRNSLPSVSSPSRQSGHKKSRNHAFTGEDFQRLIISQLWDHEERDRYTDTNKAHLPPRYILHHFKNTPADYQLASSVQGCLHITSSQKIAFTCQETYRHL